MTEALSSAWTWARLLEEMGSNTYAVARSRRAACFVLSLPLDADDQRIEAAMLEAVQLRAGGCARDQSTTQFCAEVVERDARIARMRENARGTGAVLKELSAENEYLRAEVLCRINHSNALYFAIVKRLTPYFPPGNRDLDWDVLPGTLEGLARSAADLRTDLHECAKLVRNGDLHTIMSSAPEVMDLITAAQDRMAAASKAQVQERDKLRAALTAEQEKRRAADAVLAHLAVWCLTYGVSLCPRGGDADTFGDGVRAMKEQVAGILRASSRSG